MANKTAHEPDYNLETNEVIEANLREMADLLEQQEADGFRVTAYRHAADTITAMDGPLAKVLVDAGMPGLIALPAIGSSIAAAITEMLQTGRWAQLERLRGTTAPEKLFCTVPGIGPTLAAKLHDELHIDTLETLEMAAHDGRLKKVPGFAARRISIIKASLQERLGRRRLRNRHPAAVPSVELLLDVDREYRQRAAKDDLRKIAPKRFNPDGRAWLAVLHTHRNDWDFTAMFSNTHRAHALNKIRDWVIIYFHADGIAESQGTIVTETIGPWRGYRVVRGREAACADYYRKRDEAA